MSEYEVLPDQNQQVLLPGHHLAVQQGGGGRDPCVAQGKEQIEHETSFQVECRELSLVGQGQVCHFIIHPKETLLVFFPSRSHTDKEDSSCWS